MLIFAFQINIIFISDLKFALELLLPTNTVEDVYRTVTLRKTLARFLRMLF